MMKLYAVLFTIFATGFMANASYICPDGTVIQRDSSESSITITIGGSSMTCIQIHSGQCSSQTTTDPRSEICAGKATGSSCNFSSAMCDPTGWPTGSYKYDDAGYPICACMSGE